MTLRVSPSRCSSHSSDATSGWCAPRRRFHLHLHRVSCIPLSLVGYPVVSQVETLVEFNATPAQSHCDALDALDSFGGGGDCLDMLMGHK